MKTKPCPKCQHPKSTVETYDGDYWRICERCHMATRPCASAKEATRNWNDRTVSPEAAGGDEMSDSKITRHANGNCTVTTGQLSTTFFTPMGAAAQIALLQQEVEQLHAIVDRLPRTADGVPVVPGVDRVWWPNADDHTDHWQQGETPGCYGLMPCWTYETNENGEAIERQIRVDECYSSREAAERARQGVTK
jgi:hypothetical protein